MPRKDKRPTRIYPARGRNSSLDTAGQRVDDQQDFAVLEDAVPNKQDDQ